MLLVFISQGLISDKLNQWLLVKVTQVEALSFDRIQESGRKTVELIKAFGDMLGKTMLAICHPL